MGRQVNRVSIQIKALAGVRVDPLKGHMFFQYHDGSSLSERAQGMTDTRKLSMRHRELSKGRRRD